MPENGPENMPWEIRLAMDWFIEILPTFIPYSK